MTKAQAGMRVRPVGTLALGASLALESLALELCYGLSHACDYGAFFTTALALASLFPAILG